jgi:hypothetical protein
MPYLLTFSGISIARRYLLNWYSLIFVYLGISPNTIAEFRNGKKIKVSKHDYEEFREELFQQYLKDRGFKYTVQNGKLFVETNNKIRLFLIPGYSNVLDEIYLLKVYGSERLDGRPVIDIGASIGDSSLYFARLGASKVYSYEVDVRRYNIAVENIRINKMTDVIEIYNEEGNSKNISSLIQENKLSKVFLKLDCEGCENEVILRLTDATFRSINDIIMEYHAKPSHIVNKLVRLGYTVRKSTRLSAREGFITARSSLPH